MYIRSVREGDIQLHVHSIFELLKYFFAHNTLTYARLLPLQLYTYQLVEKDFPSLWEEFSKGNFVVTKSKIKFTSIGLDHGLEQEIKKLKILGGIKGVILFIKILLNFIEISIYSLNRNHSK